MYQRWRVSLHARARGFHLRLRASKVLPGWGNGQARFSIIVRVRSFILKVRSGAPKTPSTISRKRNFGSRLLRLAMGLFRRLSPPSSPGNDVVVPEANQEFLAHPAIRRLRSLCLGSSEKKGVSFPFQERMMGLLGSLAFLSHSASRRDHAGMVVHAAVSFLYLIMQYKISMDRSARSPVVLAALLASFLSAFTLGGLHFMGQISEATWTVCFNALSVTCLLQLALRQVVFSKILLLIKRNAWFVWVFIMGSLFLFSKLGYRRSFEVINVVIDGPTTWIPYLALIFQTLLHVLKNPTDTKELAILVSSLYFLINEIPIFGPFELNLCNVNLPYFSKKTIKEL